MLNINIITEVEVILPSNKLLNLLFAQFLLLNSLPSLALLTIHVKV
jgi:hypothetical protein